MADEPWNEDFPHELYEAPVSVPAVEEPTEGTTTDQALLTPGKTIEGAAKLFVRSCQGGDAYPNNCAHFLSNAFILAGFTELREGDQVPCIKSWCHTAARRPKRARNMWCWFDAMATKKGGRVESNTGFWAVFQLNGYWGGHVVIVDSKAWKFYGTGWYDDWSQHSYQW